ncbi:MAG: hypothetical protein LUI12_00900 [Clostridiales bacterium]|nr:hypothetical protein [Clostridiales bacterium]
MKKIAKLLFYELIIVGLCAFLGVAALAVTYLIPDRWIRENVWESSIILHNEGLGRHVWESISETMLDNYTDGLMLNVTYTTTDDGLRDILLATKTEVLRDGHDINPMESLYEVIAMANNNYQITSYGRYWHGYQIILRPLLCLFDYGDIRQINMIFQLALVFVFIYILAKSEDKRLLIPFWAMYIFLSPVTLFTSLQYSPCFYMTMFALIAIFTAGKRIGDRKRNYIFLLTGILTAYFDFLTYPFITLAVPLIGYLASSRECLSSVKKGFKDVCFYTVSWGVGYVGMWASKWVIASVFTEENVIAQAVDQLKFRSGHFSGKQSLLETIRYNWDVCNKEVLWLVLICLAAYFLYGIMKNIRKKNKEFLLGGGGTWMILLVSAYPYLWYYVTMEHSSNHSYFTWRELAITVFGVTAAGVINSRK